MCADSWLLAKAPNSYSSFGNPLFNSYIVNLLKLVGVREQRHQNLNDTPTPYVFWRWLPRANAWP